MMAEYYSKEQLLESGRTTWCDMYDIEDFLDEIPTENVLQITRCKDCKFYKVGNPNADYCYHERYEHLGQGVSYNPDDFCSYGTPKERGAK